MSKKVAILEGWSEGPWQSRKFRAALEKVAIETSKDPVNSNIIVAHSSGCFLVPPNTKARLVLLIGIPYWPERSYFTSAWINSHKGFLHHHREGEFIWWLSKLAHNFWYAISRPKKTYDLLTKHKTENLIKPRLGRKVVLVRNRDDAFCHPEIQEILKETVNYKFIEMPGGHEECWIQSKPYVDLLLKEYN